MSNERGGAIVYLTIVILAITIGFFSIDYQEERAPAFVVIAMCLVAGFFWIRILASDHKQIKFLVPLFLVALLLRVILCFSIHYLAEYGIFSEDDYSYDLIGWRIAQTWKGEYGYDIYSGFSDSEILASREIGYSYLVACFYYLFGQVPLVPKVFNCFIGTMIVMYFSIYAWNVCGEKAGKLAGILCTVFPSMVIWSALGLKDALATFAIIYSIYHAFLCSEEIKISSIVKMAIALIVLGQIRGYMFVLVGGSIALSFFFKKSKYIIRNYILGFMVILTVFMIFRQFEFGKAYTDQADFERINYYRKSLATGGSAIHVDADISSPGKALAFLPIGATYFLFAPFPWAIKSFRQVYTVPEVVTWYFLFPFFVMGFIYAFKEKQAAFAPALNVLLIVTVTYSLVEGNLGTAYRHRFQVMGIYLMLTAIGLARYYAKKKKEEKKNIPSHDILQDCRS